MAAGKAIDDAGEPLNDVEKVLNKLGISLRTTAGEFRDMEDVLDDMAAKWDTLTSVEKSQLSTAAAGTYFAPECTAMYIYSSNLNR